MTESVFHGVRLEGVAVALPGGALDEADFTARYGAERVARLRKAIGLGRILVAAPGETASSLARRAAQALPSLTEVDALLFVSQTPDAIAPATSAKLAGALGLGEGALALDVNQGCAGFTVALRLAAHLLLHPAMRKVLIMGGDTLSRHVDRADHATATLFSDAGFAALVGKGGNAIWRFATATEGSDAIAIPHGATFRMDGTAVFNFTVSKVPAQIQALLDPAVDCLLLHQANAFIVRQVARLCGFEPDRAPCDFPDFGNASSASLPLLLCDLAANHGWHGRREAILSGFGVGLTWCSVRLPIDFDIPLHLLSPTPPQRETAP